MLFTQTITFERVDVFTAMFSWKRTKKANQAGTMSGKHEVSDGTAGAVNPWVARSSNASSVRHSA